MTVDELYDKPGHLIRRMQQIAVAMFMEECAAFDLTPVQFAALVAIRENPGVDATRLSALIAFDRSTIGSVLERLEAKNLIARTATTSDKRLKLLNLTNGGAALLAGITPLVERVQERMLAPLGSGEKRQFMSLLQRLVDVNNETSRAPLRLVGDGAVSKQRG